MRLNCTHQLYGDYTSCFVLFPMWGCFNMSWILENITQWINMFCSGNDYASQIRYNREDRGLSFQYVIQFLFWKNEMLLLLTWKKINVLFQVKWSPIPPAHTSPAYHLKETLRLMEEVIHPSCPQTHPVLWNPYFPSSLSPAGVTCASLGTGTCCKSKPEGEASGEAADTVRFQVRVLSGACQGGVSFMDVRHGATSPGVIDR